MYGQQPPLTSFSRSTFNTAYQTDGEAYAHDPHTDSDEQISVHFNDGFEESRNLDRSTFDTETHVDSQRVTSRQNSRSFTGRVSSLFGGRRGSV